MADKEQNPNPNEPPIGLSQNSDQDSGFESDNVEEKSSSRKRRSEDFFDDPRNVEVLKKIREEDDIDQQLLDFQLAESRRQSQSQSQSQRNLDQVVMENNVRDFIAEQRNPQANPAGDAAEFQLEASELEFEEDEYDSEEHDDSDDSEEEEEDEEDEADS